MQPGYLRFYDARSGFVGIYTAIASSLRQPKVNSTITQEIPHREQVDNQQVQSVSLPSSVRSNCKTKNSYERMLAAQGIFKCNPGNSDEIKN